MPRGPKRNSRRTVAADTTVDDVVLKALQGGPATINDILKHFARRVRVRLEKLRVRRILTREGKGGSHREFTFKLLQPDRAAEALIEKGGGLARAATRQRTEVAPKKKRRSFARSPQATG
jgi:transposase